MRASEGQRGDRVGIVARAAQREQALLPHAFERLLRKRRALRDVGHHRQHIWKLQHRHVELDRSESTPLEAERLASCASSASAIWTPEREPAPSVSSAEARLASRIGPADRRRCRSARAGSFV
jgi:hypothetical protein